MSADQGAQSGLRQALAMPRHPDRVVGLCLVGSHAGHVATVANGKTVVNCFGKATTFRKVQTSQMETFGSRLRSLREARGWSQERLGFELEVTGATISKWENTRAEPNLGHLSKLREIFDADGATLDWFVCDWMYMKNMYKSYKHIVGDTAGTYQASPRVAETEDELAVLSRFRSMSSKRQKALLQLLDN